MPTYQTMAQPSRQTQETLSTVKRKKPKKVKVFNPEFKPGEQVSLDAFREAIGTRPEQEFNLGDLRGAIGEQKTAGGGAVPVAPERFQTPEELGTLIGQIRGVLQPLTEARAAQRTADFNKNAQDLRNRFASMGSLAGGGAASQLIDARQDLGRELDALRAEADANAIPLALQFGQLGLQESGQRFNQQMANRQFDQNRAQNLVANLGAALGIQENQLQNFIGNVGNLTNMDIAQNEWAQQFGLQRQQNDFQRWLATQGLNNEASQNFIVNLLNATSQAENSRQFNENLGENQRQFNTGTALDLSRLFGQAIQPGAGIEDMFGQVQGQDTLDLQGLRQNIINANRNFNLSQQRENRLADSQEFNQALDRWKATGTLSESDAGILGLPAGTPYSNTTNSEQAQQDEEATEIADLYQFINHAQNTTNSSGQTPTPEQIRQAALTQAQNALQQKVISSETYMRLLQEINRIYPPSASDAMSQQDIMPTIDQIMAALQANQK